MVEEKRGRRGSGRRVYELLHAAELGVGAGAGMSLLSTADGSLSSRVNIFHLLRSVPAKAIH